jgi:hypothetical protein
MEEAYDRTISIASKYKRDYQNAPYLSGVYPHGNLGPEGVFVSYQNLIVDASAGTGFFHLLSKE